jgi:WD40 repeat protein/serine/threonine protein kinase
MSEPRVPDSASLEALVGQVADEFTQRLNRGERPDVEEYAARYPHVASLLREVLQALGLIRLPAVGEASDVRPRLPEQLGDYRILREVGRGGMGIVYEAEQESLGRHVALKVLPAAALLDPQQLRRFQAEARAAARLHHNNIVPVFGVGEDKGLYYYVMQFIQGQGLDEVLAELRKLRQEKSGPSGATASGQSHRQPIGELSAAVVAEALLTRSLAPGGAGIDSSAGACAPLPAEPVAGPAARPPGSAASSPLSDSGRRYWQSVAHIGVQVAEALAYAHGQGVEHRDIKPANLLLDAQGTAWVTDFGLAKAADSENLTHTGDVVGTLRYMAPERFRGAADLRSDVYSLGLTLYEMLTLQPAYAETDRNRLIGRILNEEPPRPRKRTPEVPADLETIVLKAMAREPAHRYQTATELAEDCKRFLEDKPIRARPVGAAERLGRWCRRNPALAAATGLAGAALLAVAAISLCFALFQARALKDSEEQRRQLTETNAELERTDQQRLRFTRLAASLTVDQGLALCEQGHANRGLLWLAHSLQMVPPDDEDMQRTIRSNLRAWSSQVHRLSAVWVPEVEPAFTALSPDAQTVLVAHSDATTRLWDASTGLPRGDLLPHGGKVRDASFSADGRFVLTGSEDRTARLWEVASGQPAGPLLRHPAALAFVALSPDGQTAATGSLDSMLQLWATRTGEPLGPPLRHGDAIRAVVFSPDSRVVLTGSADKTARLWAAENCQPLGPALPHPGPVSWGAFSPDSQTVLTASGETARLWTVADSRPLGSPLKHEQQVRSAAFSPDGKAVLTASEDRTVRRWNAATGQPLGKALLHPASVCCATISRDGLIIVTTCEDGSAWLWETVADQPRACELEHPGPVHAVRISPDRQSVLTHDAKRGQRVWGITAVKSPRVLVQGLGKLSDLALAAHGQCMATGSEQGTAQVWDAISGKPLGPLLPHAHEVWAVALSPDGAAVLTGGVDGTAQLWESASGKRLGPPLRHGAEIDGVAFSPDGRTMLTGCRDGRARLWDVLSCRCATDATVKQAGPPLQHTKGITKVTFSSDGQTILTACLDGKARLWHATTGELLGVLPHPDEVASVAFRGDGQVLLTGSYDGKARLWQTSTGELLGSPLVHKATVYGVAFSPDGQTVATASNDGTARLWHISVSLHDGAASCKPIGPALQHGQGLCGVAFDPDGKTFLTACADGAIRRWEVPAPLPGDPDRIILWSQVITGLELDANGGFRWLDPRSWQERRQRLAAVGGPLLP